MNETVQKKEKKELNFVSADLFEKGAKKKKKKKKLQKTLIDQRQMN